MTQPQIHLPAAYTPLFMIMNHSSFWLVDTVFLFLKDSMSLFNMI